MAQKPEKRSLTIAGHATSISLEKPFWDAVREIAATLNQSLPELIADIDANSREASLSSAIRVYVLSWYRDKP